jgi:two-component system, OmpR family, alkaline phosphatase synthesis response regulator PhoP
VTGAAARILVIEDNAGLVEGLKDNLEFEGYAVDVAEDGAAGLELARRGTADLIVLDLILPRVDGYTVLKRLRDEGCETPVLILSARGEEADKVRGFRYGADQYLTKPFGLLELLARIEHLLRRFGARPARPTGASSPTPADRPPLRVGDIEIDEASHTVAVGGRPAALTPMAYKLLLALVRRNGAAADRIELLREVWGTSGAVMSRTVDAHVAELRRKLERDPANPRHILTVWKVGYRFRA